MTTQQVNLSRKPQSALQILGARLLGHSAIYAGGTVLSMAFAVVNLAVLTRLLDRSEFGALAVLTLYSGLLTVLCNLGTVQGTLQSAYYGGSVGEGADEEDDLSDALPATATKASDNRRRLATGLITTLSVGAIVTGLSIVFAPELSNLVLGSRRYETAIVFATAAGVLGSAWRLVSAIPRMERRPRAYVGLQIVRFVTVLGAGAALVLAGYGLTGAVAGLALGKVVAVSIALVVSRHRFRLAYSRRDAIEVTRNGRRMAVISVAFFLARTVDVYVLSRYASNIDVALYRVAERIAAFPAMGVSAALFAWGPLMRGPIRVALDKQSAVDVARGRLVTYFLYLTIAVTMCVTVWAETLVRIAPPSYARAAALLPLMGIAAGVHGSLTILYRMTRFPGKMTIFRRIAVLTCLTTLGASLALVPTMGARGGAIASIIAPLPGVLILLWCSQRGKEPLPLPWAHLAAAAAVALVVAAASFAARPLSDRHEAAVDVVLTVGYFAILLALNIFPRNEAVGLLRLFGAPVRTASERRRLRARLARLTPTDRDLLDQLTRRRERPADIAARRGETDDVVLARFVALLREIDDIGHPSEMDSMIGRYLLSGQSTPQRDRAGHLLSMRDDALPLELDRLGVVVQRVRAMR